MTLEHIVMRTFSLCIHISQLQPAGSYASIFHVLRLFLDYQMMSIVAVIAF